MAAIQRRFTLAYYNTSQNQHARKMLDQHAFWLHEHTKESALLSLHDHEPSHSVKWFAEFLRRNKITPPQTILDLGCGKGRNAIYLARLGYTVHGFDFVSSAIDIAQASAFEAGVHDSVHLSVASLVESWPYLDQQFDIAIDCYSSIEIHTEEGREVYINELTRTVRRRGLIFVAVVSDTDEFERDQLQHSPGPLPNSTVWPRNSKFQKDYSPGELLSFYHNFKYIELEVIKKKIRRFGETAESTDIYAVIQHL